MISDTTTQARLAKIRVAVRIRPPLPREVGPDGKFLSCVGIGPNTEKGQTIFINSTDQPVLLSQSQTSAPSQVSRYTFDKIFPVNVSQEDVYTYTMGPLVKQVLEGYNATVLAYGQTGSGKTHTILGQAGDKEGLAGRTIRFLLQNVKSLRLSVLQIYQEAVFDLLSANADESLVLRHSHSGVSVENLRTVEIDSVGRAERWLETALSRRAVGGTLMNEVSSRSHMIITISITTDLGEAKLNLVDLAGSERLEDSKAEGKRLQETCAINSSLFALVAVVESLSSSKPFIPYRNSKLTWILSDSLGGNSLTTILATVSPSQKFAKETKSTLKFAHSCKKIEHLVVKNEQKSRNVAKKVRPVKTEMPWKKTLVDVKCRMVETSLGPVCCYYAGPPDGPPVIMMHGCPSSFGEFQHFLPCLTHYGFRLIGLDQPGYGNSPGVRATSRSDKATETGGPVDILKEIIKHHNLKQTPTLLGFDWGGGIALTFAVLYPARVSRVISFLPSFSETPETQLHQMMTPTMILWVKRDTNHSWKHFKGIANKIPGVRIEFVECPIQSKEVSRNCYEKISDNILAPIVDFLGKNESSEERPVYKTKEVTTKSTVGKTVIEICNINFEDDFAPEEIEVMMSRPDPELNAVTLFKNLGVRYGFEELYRAEENHTHKLHRVVTAVFRALPSLHPDTVTNNYQDLVRLGILESLPGGLEQMLQSPRYFPGRKVLIKASELERVYSADTSAEGGITKIAKIVEVSDNNCTVALDPYENYGREIKVEVARDDIITLNNPHIFHVEQTGKFAFEDGIHCDYRKKIVKAKVIEIGFQLSKLISKLNFLSPDCVETQRAALVKIRSCLNLITFQSGVDRSRVSRSDCAGRLAIYGQVGAGTINSQYYDKPCPTSRVFIINPQGHCHGVSSTMASFLLPYSPLLGLDLKYRGVYTFENGEERKANNSVERHQCLEVTARPSCQSFIVDLWNAEKYDNQSWLCIDMDTAYNRFMYPNGALILKTRPRPQSNFDFSNSTFHED